MSTDKLAPTPERMSWEERDIIAEIVRAGRHSYTEALPYLRSAAAAAYARGLERAAHLTEGTLRGNLAFYLARAMRTEAARALAGTEAQPPPERVKELLEALRGLLAAVEEAGWLGCIEERHAARRALLGASDPAPSEGAAPHATERGEK